MAGELKIGLAGLGSVSRMILPNFKAVPGVTVLEV